MNKAQLVDLLFADLKEKLTKRQINAVLLNAFKRINSEVEGGGEVVIIDFGRFYLSTPATRDYFNFGKKVMEKMTPPPRVGFKPSRVRIVKKNV